jgi:hypothetical protein
MEVMGLHFTFEQNKWIVILGFKTEGVKEI